MPMKVTTVFALLALLFTVNFMENTSAANEIHRYIITEANAPTSFDPLDADSTENLPAARMLYLTPLETSPSDELTSTVLESFKYDNKSHLITWIVRKGLKFSDGSDITPSDVAFSVARMAYTRPLFPVIQYIDGLQSWTKYAAALETLPSGIHVDGQKIQIKLTRNVTHPLFRFCLELFSIIPKSAVDLKTNKLKTKSPPTSGYYVLDSQGVDGWMFRKRAEFPLILGAKAPDQILFQFKPSTEVTSLLKEIDKQTVIATNEGLFSPAELSVIREQAEMRSAPSSRFGMLLLNPHIAPFNKKECRQAFVRAFREVLTEENFGQFQIESSVFTKILPGYLKSSELEKTQPKPSESCLKELKTAKIEWASVKGLPNYIFETAMKKTIAKLGMENVSYHEEKSKAEMTALLVENKIGIIPATTGFWPLDPAGDLQMLFTPNLHKVLSFVSSDEKLQSLIHQIQNETNPEKRSGNFETVNRHLYSEALFNVYVHFRRFFITHKNRSLNDIPLAITSAAPWQVFELK
jgi:ABC-type transport system substrate-binding protein